MDKILFYEGPWYFLSNFSSFAVHWYGSLWMTAEHAYQSAKFESPITRQLIHDARSAHDAKTIARVRKSDARSDWNSVKLAVMEEILRAKVEQHPYIRKKAHRIREYRAGRRFSGGSVLGTRSRLGGRKPPGAALDEDSKRNQDLVTRRQKTLLQRVFCSCGLCALTRGCFSWYFRSLVFSNESSLTWGVEHGREQDRK